MSPVASSPAEWGRECELPRGPWCVDGEEDAGLRTGSNLHQQAQFLDTNGGGWGGRNTALSLSLTLKLWQG